MSNNSCINPKSLDVLARKENIDRDILKSIVYEYWNTTNSDQYYPSQVYIQSRLGKGTYQESSASVREQWSRNYNKPLKFKSKELLDAAKKEALAFFPKEAIYEYKNFNGEYILAVKTPVEKYNPSIKDYLGNKNPDERESKDFNLIYTERETTPSTQEKINKNYKRDSRLFSHLKDTKKIEVDLDVKEAVNIISSNKDYKNIIDLLKNLSSKAVENKKEKLLKDLNIQVIDPNIPGYSTLRNGVFKKHRAIYDADTKTIIIDGLADFKDGDASSVLLHEIMHHITLQRLATNKQSKERLSEILKEYRRNILPQYDIYSDKHGLEEFIADIWTNPDTINRLKSIKSKNQTLWDKVKQWFKDILNGLFADTKGTLFTDASNELINLIEGDPTKYITGEYTETESSTINIYAGTGENAELSNFAERPFTLPEGFTLPNGEKLAPTKTLNGNNTIEFNSVEQAFQAAKIHYTKTHISPNVPDTTGNKFNSQVRLLILNSGNSSEVKQMGKTFKNFNTEAWDRDSHEIMKAFMKASFEQNPEALQKLLATGNATLTHTQDKGKWGKEFPKILMEVRDELKNNNTPSSYEGTIAPEENTIFVFGSNPEGRHGAGAAKTAREKFGAIYGQGEGLQGNSYALPTKDISKRNDIGIIKKNEDDSVEFNVLTPYGPRAFKFKGDILYAYQTADKVWKEAEDFGIQDMNVEEIKTYVRKKINNDLKSISPEQITENIRKMYEVARQNPTKQFKVAYTNGLNEATLNGYTGAEMIKMFKDAGPIPSNVVFSKNWTDHWSEVASERVNTIQPESPVVEETKQTEETKPEERTIRGDLAKIASASDRMAKQVDALLDSNIINSIEVRHTGELIMNAMSDLITEIQRKPESIADIFPDVKTNVDFKTATRRQIVDAIGVNRLLDEIKRRHFDSENEETLADVSDLSVQQQMDLIVDNWEAVTTFASDVFALNEGFGIVRNTLDGSFSLSERDEMEDDDTLNDAGDIESTGDLYEDEREHHQKVKNTEDIYKNASTLVKGAFQQCYLLDKEGNKVKSKWGIYERMNPKDAMKSVIAWTLGTQSLSRMVENLKQKESKNPWLRQIIDRLEDKSGTEIDFQSQFFTTIATSKQSYDIGIKNDDGKYSVAPVNDNPSSNKILKHISAQQKLGIHPLFQNGINQTSLGRLRSNHAELATIAEAVKRGEEFTQTDMDKALDSILDSCRILGFTDVDPDIAEEAVTKEALFGDGESNPGMINYLNWIIKSLDTITEYQKNHPDFVYTPFKFRSKEAIDGTLKRFLAPITDIMDQTATNVVYDDGNMYQEHVTPSFLKRRLEQFKWQGRDFKEFIQKEYGYSEWFKKINTRFNEGWRGGWLARLATDKTAREILTHKVELNFNKHRYMKTLSSEEYLISMLSHYWAQQSDEKHQATAFFRIPMQSNKPSSEYIRFYAEKGDNYKENIVDGIYDIFEQELDRIRTVRARNRKKSDPDFIKNWDTQGRQFCFLPFLNSFIEDSATAKSGRERLTRGLKAMSSEETNELKSLLTKAVSGSVEGKEARLIQLVKKAIEADMEETTARILNSWEKQGIFNVAQNVDGLLPAEMLSDPNVSDETKMAKVRSQLENFIWNDHYASMNILELMVGDIAAYEDAENLQKRLSELHAPGIRPNTEAADYSDPSKRVSDGVYRTLVLTDWDDFISNVIDNLREVFDQKIANSTDEATKKANEALKDYLVRPRTYNPDGSVKDEGGLYYNINVADAQAFNSPTSYRKKAIMFGRWSKNAEEVYKRLLNGEVNMTDIEAVFPPLKPFVYGMLHKQVGLDTIATPITNMPIPFQAKNSEYLLIMAAALTKDAKTSKPNLLKVLFDIMEESAQLNPGRGIDTIQFESAIKSGLQGKINIHQFANMENGEAAARAFITQQIYKKDAEGRLTSEYDTRSFIHETDFGNYCIQQEVPEHFTGHSQIQGSQERVIIPSDLDFTQTPCEWVEPDGTKRSESDSKKVREEYEKTFADNVNTSIDNVRTRFGFSFVDKNGVEHEGFSKKERNIVLSKLLGEEILSSPRYGTELYQACSIKDGEFRVAPGDPIQAKRIEQLLNSIIKKSVNKQELPGGPIVQVSSFGTSKALNIRFNAKSGGLLKLKSEFTPTEKYKTYEDYVKAEQAGVAHFEVLAPAYWREFYKYFTDKNGNIDVEALEILNPDLLKMITYRIPTEDKYSIAPVKIVGFLPKEAGSTLMLPYDLTTIDDSDFDVDKRYTILKHLYIASRVEPKGNETMSEAEKSYIEHNRKSIHKELTKAINLRAILTNDDIKALENKVKDEENYELRKKAITRVHEEKLQDIERKNSMIEDAIVNATFSTNKEKDEKIYDKSIDRQEKGYEKAIEKENARYQAALDKLDNAIQSKVKENLSKAKKQKIYDRIDQFLNVERYQPASNDDALTRELRKAYLHYMFKVIEPTTGVEGNNNKMFAMTWGILNNPSVAPQMLNPGGFDTYKKEAYAITAYKLSNGTRSFDDLYRMSISDLKKLCKSKKDLTWVDTQLQFYKQNAAAASLIGVFAVNKVAHAMLEADDLNINMADICGEDPLSIDDYTFDGLMKVDPRFDKNGVYVGKTLGSGVSASADAAKENALDLLNVNMSTVNILTTLTRLGMPFNSAALFMSQQVIDKMITEYNKQTLIEGSANIDNVIQGRIDELKKDPDLQITEGSQINTEALTREELIQGLLEDVDKKIEYKTLIALQKIKALSDALQNPTFATRFNSIASAVGPLNIDNLITEHKVNKFRISEDNENTGFYMSDGTPVDIDTIFGWHPILDAFHKTVALAIGDNMTTGLMSDMPSASRSFRNVLNWRPKKGRNAEAWAEMVENIYRDRQLMNKLVDFFTSYLLVQDGLIDASESNRKYYIEEFPKEFFKENYKQKHPDNKLIQDIALVESSKTNRAFLQIDTTGMTDQEKAPYRSAWTELHKKDPVLSSKLRTYWFFRGGIGFSPKTSTSLMSNYVREHWDNTDKQGKTITYNQIYKNLSSVIPEIVLDQFVRNNWNERKLVPMKGNNSKYMVDSEKGILKVSKAQAGDFKKTMYMKTKSGNDVYLWKQEGADPEGNLVYNRVDPLGDNNEYIEMSMQDIVKAGTKTTTDSVDNDTSEIGEKSTPDTNTGMINPVISNSEKAGEISKLAQMIQKYLDSKNSQVSGVEAERRAQINVNATGGYIRGAEAFLSKVLEFNKIEFDKDNVIEEAKKFC